MVYGGFIANERRLFHVARDTTAINARHLLSDPDSVRADLVDAQAPAGTGAGGLESPGCSDRIQPGMVTLAGLAQGRGRSTDRRVQSSVGRAGAKGGPPDASPEHLQRGDLSHRYAGLHQPG